jgi:transcriptional regulator with XRE-family HTH domain
VTVNQAVRALRKHVRKTQQVFATELGISISSLNNYERKRIPEPKQLATFATAARVADRPDLADVFSRALGHALGWYDYYSGSGLTLITLDPNNPENWYELACVEALERILTNATQYQDLRHTVMAAISLVVERQGELELPRQKNWERWVRFEEESVRRGYAVKIGGKVKWLSSTKRENQR